MENHYLKQYPDLMAGKKIMYVHGFGSSGQSGTVKRLHEVLPNAEIIAEDMPLHPAKAMQLLHKLCDERRPDLIIGTSMGGMYTEMLYGYDRICVNPALQMGDTMHEHNMMGKQVWMNPRKDGEKEFIVTKALEKEYKEITKQCFSGVTEEEKRRVFGLFGDRDPIVHTFGLFSQHYPQAIHFHGEHRMDDRSFLHGVVPVIRWISDRQEGRERPIVYIDSSTLRDEYGHPKSSLNKAFDLLIEHYQVFVVCPAPTEDPQAIAGWQDWVKETFAAPAWNHVIFTNQKAQLYGDYFIDCHPDANFMGTRVELGSDDMKTWEDVIVFFERLGGQ